MKTTNRPAGMFGFTIIWLGFRAGWLGGLFHFADRSSGGPSAGPRYPGEGRACLKTSEPTFLKCVFKETTRSWGCFIIYAVLCFSR